MTFLEFVVAYCVSGTVLWHFAQARLQRARREHLLVCREVYSINLAWNLFWTGVYITVCGLLATGWGTLVAGAALVAFDFGMSYLPGEPGNQPLGPWSAWKQYRRHRGHDDDCEYGPRRTQGRVARPVLTWHKVAIRPGFVPT